MTVKSLNTVLGALNGQSSKADEIEALRLVKLAIDDNTYLASLLSEDLVKWAISQIKNDFPADVYENWKSAAREAEQAQTNWTRDVAGFTEMVTKQSAELEAANAAKARLEASNAELRVLLARSEEAVQRLIDRKDQLEDQLATAAYASGAEITRLKVMIFDLEHPAQ